MTLVHRCFLILILAIILQSSAECWAFSVIIDPGHGGLDSGAKRGALKESDIVLSLGKQLAEELKKHSDIQVTLTRTDNLLIPLTERVALANQQKADLFLSLHANSSPSKHVSGLEFYFNESPTLMKNKEDSQLSIVEKIKSDLTYFGKTKDSLNFLKSMQMQVNDIATVNARSVIRQAPFYVVENTEMPSALIEVGFISNLREARKLITPEYQSQLVQTLVRAVLDYKEKSDKQTTSR